MPTAESGIYKCIECEQEFSATPALPRCQLCGKRNLISAKIHVDAQYFTGVIHKSCLEDFDDIAQEMDLDNEGKKVFFFKKRDRWRVADGLKPQGIIEPE